MYDSPTLRFFNGIYSIVEETITSKETHFWKGFWFLLLLGISISIILAIWWASMTYNKWIGLGIISFFVAIDVISLIGSLFDNQ